MFTYINTLNYSKTHLYMLAFKNSAVLSNNNNRFVLGFRESLGMPLSRVLSVHSAPKKKRRQVNGKQRME